MEHQKPPLQLCHLHLGGGYPIHGTLCNARTSGQRNVFAQEGQEGTCVPVLQSTYLIPRMLAMEYVERYRLVLHQ